MENKSISQKKDIEEVTSIGQLIYQKIIPDELDKLFKNGGKYFYIACNYYGIPWELLHDGTQFLGIKHFIGRNPANAIHSVGSKSQNFLKSKFFIVSNPTDDLDGAQKECELIAETLREEKISYNIMSSSQVSVEQVLYQFNSTSYDFIHYCGHTEKVDDKRNAGDYCFVLSDNKKLPISSLKGMKGMRPGLVFLNSCGAGTIERHESKNKGRGCVISFLDAGALGVVASETAVPDSSASNFANEYYSHILSGKSVGETLAALRQEFAAADDSNIWCSYVFFGDPALTYYKINAEEVASLPESLDRIFFDDDAWKALEQACSYAQYGRVVSTTHLFVGIVDQLDYDAKLNLFKKHGLSNLDAEDEMKNLFRKDAKNSEHDISLKFSKNADEFLKTVNILSIRKNENITLGNMIEVLEAMDNVSYKIVLDRIRGILRVRKAQRTIFTGGFLNKEKLDKEVQNSIIIGNIYAKNKHMITTTDLLVGMMLNTKSILSNFFKANNFDIKKLKHSLNLHNQEKKVINMVFEIDKNNLSDNTVNIFITAWMLAEETKHRISEKHILEAIMMLECSAREILRSIS